MNPSAASGSWRRLLLIVLASVTAARMVFVSAFPLLDDEAYYWTWSRHLAWGYPDHPPMIAFVVRATTALAGNTSLGVRLGPVLFALGLSMLLYDLAKRLTDEGAGQRAALWFQLVPALAAGAVFTAPDAPFGFFWILSIWWLWRARTTGRMFDWAMTGTAVGLAALSKLTVAFIALGLVGFLVTSPDDRRWLRRPHPYVAAVLSAGVFAPVMLWNADHRWATFEKTFHPTSWVDLNSPLGQVGLYLVVQLGYYGVLAGPLLVAALASTLRRSARPDPRQLLLAWTGLPIVALTWIASASGIPKPHWPAPGYMMALIPAAAWWSIVRTRRWWWRAVVPAAIGLNLAILIAMHALPFTPNSSFTGQIWGWDQVTARLRAYVAETPSESGVFVFVAGYQTGSQIQYHTGEAFAVLTRDLDAFSVRHSYHAFIDWNAIFVNDVPPGPGAPLRRMFRRVEPLPPIEVVWRGRVVRRFQVYRGYTFRGFPRPQVRPDWPNPYPMR